MKRVLLAAVLALCSTTLAQAHFVWIIPDGKDGAKVIFSDALEPDTNVPIESIKHMKLWIRDSARMLTTPDWKIGEGALVLGTTGTGQRELAGACRYGVISRGGKTFLLNYYAKYLPNGPEHAKPWALLALDVLPGEGGKFHVQFQGKPAVGAEVVAITPDGKQLAPLSTNNAGEVTIDTSAAGLHGIRARHIEPKAGDVDGKKYEETRHYATLVFTVSKRGAKTNGRDPTALALKDPTPDPVATKLLADARAARATWQQFPGFAADLEVNLDGKVEKGKVMVDANGKVKLEGVEKAHETWAKRALASVVGHRLGGSGGTETPCAFADADEHHPLGRLIAVLNDELHSSYRIRDRQIMVVNRTTPESRFSITMQENRPTGDGKFLPASFVVHHWDKSGTLTKTESNYQAWTQAGGIDLPREIRVITATKELSTQSLKLSNHVLLRAAAK